MSAVCNPVLETPTLRYSVQPGCGWLDPGYYQATYSSKTRRGQVHTGIDLNATTGGDTDYGNRVRACADGVVIEAGDFASWGGIVLIHHPHLGVWSQSAHLVNITVKAGDSVRMGDPIGQIGKGAREQFWAHLHFEIRRSLLPANFWPSTRFPNRAGAEAYIREHYLNPEKWLEERSALRTLEEMQAARGEPKAVTDPVPGVRLAEWQDAARHPMTPLIVKPRPEVQPSQGYLYGPARSPDMAPTGDWVSIAVDGSGVPLVDAQGHARTVVFDEALARKKGLVE